MENILCIPWMEISGLINLLSNGYVPYESLPLQRLVFMENSSDICIKSLHLNIYFKRKSEQINLSIFF